MVAEGGVDFRYRKSGPEGDPGEDRLLAGVGLVSRLPRVYRRPAVGGGADWRKLNRRSRAPIRVMRRSEAGRKARPLPGGRPSATRHRASQALNRSFTSSRCSLHHSVSLTSARPMFRGLVGRCGAIATPVCRWVVTSGRADRRTGL